MGKVIKILKWTLLAGTTLTLFTNCVNDEGKVQEQAYQGIETDGLDYQASGGFSPIGVGGLMPFTSIKLIQSKDGRVSGLFENERCTSKGVVSSIDYLEVVSMIDKSPVIVGAQSFIQDAGTSTVQLTKKSVASPLYFLAESPQSYKREVLVDGAAIESRIRAIGARIQSENGCLEPALTKVSALTYTRYELPTFDVVDYPFMDPYLIQREAISVDLNLRVDSTGQVLLNGKIYAQQYEQKSVTSVPYAVSPECITTFNNQIVEDPSILAAAAKITLSKNMVLCLAAQRFDPYWRYQDPYMKIAKADGSTISGGMGCFHNEQLENHQEFLQRMDKWLQVNSRCGSNPLLVRPRATDVVQ
ncbi:MAG: hypothetical protein AB7F86_11655 [Bdellovibrionales bacterium]